MSNSKFNAAFIAAYGTNVVGADTKTIERFNELIDAGVDADLIHNEIHSDYTSLMDALGMFNDGVAYGSTQLFEKAPPEYLALADSLQGMIEVFGDSFGDGESETVDVARQALVAIGYVHPSVRLPAASTTDIKIDIGQLCNRDDETAGTVSAAEKMTPDQEKQIATAIIETLVAHGVIASDANVTWPMILLALHEFKNSAPKNAQPDTNGWYDKCIDAQESYNELYDHFRAHEEYIGKLHAELGELRKQSEKLMTGLDMNVATTSTSMWTRLLANLVTSCRSLVCWPK